MTSQREQGGSRVKKGTFLERVPSLLKLFVSISVVLGIAGFVAGYSESRSDNLASLFSSLDLVQDNNVVMVRHLCDNTWTHSWDPVRGVRSHPNRLIEDLEQPFRSRAFSPGYHADFLKAIVGGASGSLTLRELAKRAHLVEGEGGHTIIQKLRAVPEPLLVVVFAVGAGYFGGYWLGHGRARRCDDPRTMKLLGTAEFWSKHISEFVQLYIIEHATSTERGQLGDHSHDAPLFCPYPEVAAAIELDRRIGTTYIPTPDDLKVLVSLGEVVALPRSGARRRFERCIAGTSKRIREALGSGQYMNDYGSIVSADSGLWVPSTPDCVDTFGVDSIRLTKDQLEEWRTAPFIRAACSRVRDAKGFL